MPALQGATIWACSRCGGHHWQRLHMQTASITRCNRAQDVTPTSWRACSAGNYAFGVARVVAALQPLECRLSPLTWAHARRCLLALAERVAEHTLFITVCPCAIPFLLKLAPSV